MATPINKAILFLYEGETEGEFYQRVIEEKIILHNRKVRITKGCLIGNFNINSKVANAIYNYIERLKYKGSISSLKLNVFVALDREGDRSVRARGQLGESEVILQLC